MAATESRTDDVRWNLSDLCADAAEARAGWSALVERSADFALRYRGKIASLDAAGMRAVFDESDELAQEVSRLQVYTYLRLSMNATDVEANDLTTIGRDRGGDIENDLIFLGLEWIALDDEAAEAMLTATEESYGIGHKWFDAKARLLGLDRLALADQYAPIGEARAFSWPEAVEVVDTSFRRFAP